MGWPVGKVPGLAVEKWYDEIKDYDYGHPVFGHSTGHFTQVGSNSQMFLIQFSVQELLFSCQNAKFPAFARRFIPANVIDIPVL